MCGIIGDRILLFVSFQLGLCLDHTCGQDVKAQYLVRFSKQLAYILQEKDTFAVLHMMDGRGCMDGQFQTKKKGNSVEFGKDAKGPIGVDARGKRISIQNNKYYYSIDYDNRKLFIEDSGRVVLRISRGENSSLLALSYCPETDVELMQLAVLVYVREMRQSFRKKEFEKYTPYFQVVTGGITLYYLFFVLKL